MSENVRVEFDPPRECVKHGKAWRLTAGDDVDFVPRQCTHLVERQGNVVTAVLMPADIAEEKGWEWTTTDTFQEEVGSDQMTRNDWYLLVIAAAMVIHGDDSRNIHHNARKLARRLQGEA